MKQAQYTVASRDKLSLRGRLPETNQCPATARERFYPSFLKTDNSARVTLKKPVDNYLNRYFVWTVMVCLMVIIQGCSKTPLQLANYSKVQETPEHFIVCHGYGCRLKALVELNSQEWLAVKAPLKQFSTSPAQERIKIAQSIALIEQITGQKTGTDKDVGGATIIGQGVYQMDCIDETINTSKYLNFLHNDGLIRLHDITTPARRGAFVDGAWPHNTAVIKERETGKRFAIDSWFADNGEVPYVIPLEIWLDGWRPLAQKE